MSLGVLVSVHPSWKQRTGRYVSPGPYKLLVMASFWFSGWGGQGLSQEPDSSSVEMLLPGSPKQEVGNID